MPVSPFLVAGTFSPQAAPPGHATRASSQDTPTTLERFRDAMRAERFVPFRVYLADGRPISVVHPEYVAWNPGGRTAIIIQPDDSCQHIDLLFVTSLEFPAPERGAA